MSWTVIMEWIFALIEKCQDDRTQAEIVDGMCNPGPREIGAIAVGIRKSGALKGLRGRERRETRQTLQARALADLLAAGREQITEFVAEACEA